MGAGAGFNIKLLHERQVSTPPGRLKLNTLHAIGDWRARTFSRPVPG
jgi:hypothetical protein